MKKLIISIVFALTLFTTCFADVVNVPSVLNESKVFDFANLFTDEQIYYLENVAHDYILQHDMDIVIATIDENPEYSAQEYADNFYDHNGFGKGAVNDGLILLIDMDTRDVAISTTGNAILYYDDERIELMLDDIAPRLTEGDYYEAAKSFVDDAGYYADQGIPESNNSYYIDDNGEYVLKKENPLKGLLYGLNPLNGGHNYIVIAIVGLIYSAVATSSAVANQKTVKKATSANNYLKNQDWKVKDDRIISEHTTSVYIPPSSSSSGSSRGGYSGGSSTHHSSSGVSHGGGSRHF